MPGDVASSPATAAWRLQERRGECPGTWPAAQPQTDGAPTSVALPRPWLPVQLGAFLGLCSQRLPSLRGTEPDWTRR